MKALRLNFPQWQGGESNNIANYVSELQPLEAAQGYALGSQLLNWLAPTKMPSFTVPVSMDREDTATEHGVFAHAANKRQTAAALDILNREQPERVVTLGGDCAVSVAPFAYLAARYPDDVALLWIDAHPDLRVPFEDYTGFHAMALAAVLGQGDPDILGSMPAFVQAKDTLLVGLRSPEGIDMQRPGKFGVPWLPSEKINQSSDEVLVWLKQTGKRKLMIHLDLDALEPTDLRIAVASDPDGIRLDAVSRLINDVAAQADLVGLTVAEPMPREIIKLRRLLHSLPLLGG